MPVGKGTISQPVQHKPGVILEKSASIEDGFELGNFCRTDIAILIEVALIIVRSNMPGVEKTLSKAEPHASMGKGRCAALLVAHTEE